MSKSEKEQQTEYKVKRDKEHKVNEIKNKYSKRINKTNSCFFIKTFKTNK